MILLCETRAERNLSVATYEFVERVRSGRASFSLLEVGSIQSANLSAMNPNSTFVALEPSWAKGHTRRAAALHGLRRYLHAVHAYDEALAREPHAAALLLGRRQSSCAWAPAHARARPRTRHSVAHACHARARRPTPPALSRTHALPLSFGLLR